jgi:hypothetical protein
MIITYFAHPTGLSDIPLVLIIEAGHDVINVNTTIPLYFTRATDGEHSFTLSTCLCVYRYPRARGIGGSA